MFRYLPEQGSDIAPKVDWIHHWITDLSVFFTVAICGAMLYFAIRYRKRGGKDHETPRIEGSTFLEIVWTVVPTIICIWVAYYGIVIYNEMVEIPEDRGDIVLINAQGYRWAWDFQYQNGKTTSNEIVVPVGRPTKIILTSRDVLHGFFIPVMRVKKDAVPGMYTYVIFTPTRTGEFPAFCTEYCGTFHSRMLANVRVVSEAEFQRWKNDRTDELSRMALSPVELGRALYVDKGCNACHSLDGRDVIGPSFLNLYGSERKFTDGTSAIAEENYIRESILEPSKRVTVGFQDVMPAFEGQLSENEIQGLIAFIRSVDGSQPVEVEPAPAETVDLSELTPVERGEILYRDKICFTCHSLDGSSGIGPTFKDLYGKRARFTDGREYVADADYIRHSILEPAADIVEGYVNAMPSYQGQLSDEQIDDIIAFIQSVSNGE